MDAQKNFYQLHIKKLDIFKEQNPENGNFDVIFEIEEKKLYAHKFMLCSVSTTFDSMLSERWSKENEPIKIEGYSFADFEEFLTFIYSGECNLTNENIFTMVDIAEFYDVQVLKDNCEEFLTKMEINLDNIYPLMELADKYSLIYVKINANKFVTNNFSHFVQNEKFQDLSKSVMKKFVQLNQEMPGQEELFEAVYKWSENRALAFQELKKDFVLNDTIKEELTEFLPLFYFDKMNDVFFIKFVVQKSFLFSGNELSDIIWQRCSKYVKIIDENGKSMKGKLQCDDIEKVIEIIQMKKNESCVSWNSYFYWKTEHQKSSKPNKFIKNEKCDWYLVFDSQGDLAVKLKRQINVFDDILAELYPKIGFKLSDQCKIEVCCFV